MSITAVTVNVDVPDIAAGSRFYRNGLGFSLREEITETVHLLEAAGVRLYLLKKSPGTAPTPIEGASRSYNRHWTPVHIDLEVDDLESALATALAAGATLESRSKSEQWGAIAVCADPFGNGFCLIQPSKP